MISEACLIHNSWQNLLSSQWTLPYMQNLNAFLQQQSQPIYPEKNAVFAAFQATPFEKIKVVILGQDPYPSPGHAHGLAFSVAPDLTRLPPSLKNIFQELENDLAIKNTTGYLLPWAQQGVFLLNSVLTVTQGQAASHANQGWEVFTDFVIDLITSHKQQVVFVLWGNYAQSKGKRIDRRRHHVLESVHPSPLSAYRGFFGSRPFSKINAYLAQTGQSIIDWQL